MIKRLFGKKSAKNKQADQTNEHYEGHDEQDAHDEAYEELTPLVERMQLDESVAQATLDVLSEEAENDESAVYTVSDGYVIVAVTDEHLNRAELNPKSEEFGSFAEALSSETISSVTLARDLENGVVGIIPTTETVNALHEFDFLQDIDLRLALVPFDLTDHDEIVLLDCDIPLANLSSFLTNMNLEAEQKSVTRNGETFDVVQFVDTVDGVFVYDGQEHLVTPVHFASDDNSTNEFDDTYNDDELDDELDNEFDDDEFGDEEWDEDEFDGEEFDGDEEFDEDELDHANEQPTFEFDDDLDDDLDVAGFNAPYNPETDAGHHDSHDDYDEAYEQELNEAEALGDDTYDTYDSFDSLESDTQEPQPVTPEPTPEPYVDYGMTEEETVNAVNKLSKHGFTSTELGLDINMEIFDDHFKSMDIVRFDTRINNSDSELERVLSELRRDANVELQRFREDNLIRLRNTYTQAMRDAHKDLITALDHEHTDTHYGALYQEIQSTYEAEVRDIDITTTNRVEQLKETYEKSRENEAMSAYHEALATYDRRYKSQLDRQIESVRDTLMQQGKSTRDVSIAELFSDRRTVAKRLYDNIQTDILRDLQEEYQKLASQEMAMYDAFRKDMDAYLRNHFADDVLSSKAKAEELRQMHEAERVRKEYEQLLLAKTRQIDELEQERAREMDNLEERHIAQIETIRKEHEANLRQEKENTEEVRSLLRESQESIRVVGEQKEQELQQRLRAMQDVIDSKDVEIEYATTRNRESSRPYKFITGSVGVVALSLGLAFGFVFGVNESESHISKVLDAEQVEQSAQSVKEKKQAEIEAEREAKEKAEREAQESKGAKLEIKAKPESKPTQEEKPATDSQN